MKEGSAYKTRGNIQSYLISQEASHENEDPRGCLLFMCSADIK